MAHEIADPVRAHTEELRQYTEHDVLMQALRQQIIESVEENYIKALRNKYTRYASLSPSDLLKHLFDNYGKVTSEDIVQNENRLNEPWDGAEAFENIIDRIDEFKQRNHTRQNKSWTERIASPPNQVCITMI
jgi:hypothetical protein